MASQDNLAWLVEQRSENQALLLDLCTFGREKSQQLVQSESARTIFHLLVGAAFSLWRAVFLAERETDPKVLLDQSQTFLETLVADNAIGYYQDKKMQAWSAGYYLNNAYFRLAEVIEVLNREGITLHAGSVPEEFKQFEECDRRGMVSNDRRRAWEVGHAAAAKALALLQAMPVGQPHGA
jgi:hypothetical protein